MHIQIIDGEVTYYSPGIPIGSTIEVSEEMELLIEQLEDMIADQRTPEQVVVEMAETERSLAEQKATASEEKYREIKNKMDQIIESFPRWVINNSYEPDEIVEYEGSLYRVLQSHTSQADWTPDVSPSLYVDVTIRQVGEETGEIQEWEQPDSTNPYNTGDKVIFEGVVYESTIDGNVWSPTNHPEGWRVIDNETEG